MAEEVSRNIDTINEHGVRLASRSDGDVGIVSRMKELAGALEQATAGYRL